MDVCCTLCPTIWSRLDDLLIDQYPEPGGGRLLNRVGSLIRELASGDEQLNQTVARRVSFLFSGAEPLTVTLTDQQGVIGNYSIVPRDRIQLFMRVSSRRGGQATRMPHKRWSPHPSSLLLHNCI